MTKQLVHAPGDAHDANDGNDILKSLQAMLQGKRAPATRATQADAGLQRRRVAAGRLDQRAVHGPVREGVHDMRVQGAVGAGGDPPVY